MSDDIPNTSDTTDNVIPETELARRRAVLQRTEEMADMVKGFLARARELHELGVTPPEWLTVLTSYGPEWLQGLNMRFGPLLGGIMMPLLNRATGKPPGAGGDVLMLRVIEAALAGRQAALADRKNDEPALSDEEHDELVRQRVKTALSAKAHRIKHVIDRLFADAPKLTDASGNPRADQTPALECGIALESGTQLQGSLSITPEGTLRMAVMGEMQRRPILIEHFFDYEDVADIALVREVTATPPETSRIVTA